MNLYIQNIVMTIIVAAALIHFSRNFGQNLLIKMLLIIQLQLLFEGIFYFSHKGIFLQSQKVKFLKISLKICQITQLLFNTVSTTPGSQEGVLPKFYLRALTRFEHVEALLPRNMFCSVANYSFHFIAKSETCI